MDKINGVIKKVWKNKTKDGKDYHVVELVDGFKLSCFGAAPDDLVEGSDYSFLYEQKGDYRNYKSYELTLATDSALKKIAENTLKKYELNGVGNPDAFFGMVFNQTCQFIDVLEEFDATFNKLWELALKKRGEKL